MDDLRDLLPRAGPPPETRPTNPHQQLSQNAPQELQETVFERASALPGVVVRASLVSVPGARAFVLAEGPMAGPEAFMAGREFAHLHPPYDGSLHLVLPELVAETVIAAGWGEIHPEARRGLVPANRLMVFGPRDEKELESVWRIIRASHAQAVGE